jgi:hypothetical protein
VFFAGFRLFRDPKHRRAEIDALVCEVCGLTGEEIGVVEGLNH